MSVFVNQRRLTPLIRTLRASTNDQFVHDAMFGLIEHVVHNTEFNAQLEPLLLKKAFFLFDGENASLFEQNGDSVQNTRHPLWARIIHMSTLSASFEQKERVQKPRRRQNWR